MPQPPNTVAQLGIPGVECLEVIGRGAHSIVFRGRLDGRECAVKVRQDIPDADGARWRLRYRREAAVLGRFSHPGLASIIEAGETSDKRRPYLLMEFVDGTTLSGLLQQSAPLDEARIIEIAAALAAALAEVHRRAVVHRDIKPENVMVSADTVKLIDFGFATGTQRQAARAVAGTLRYSSPEQTGMLQRPVDGRSDLYSLGVVLYECATGRVPFVADDPSELMRQHAVDPPTPARQLNGQIGPVLAAIIDKLLAKDPDDRYATCEALLADLDAVDELARDLADGQALQLGHRAPVAMARPAHPLVGRHREYSRLESAWLTARAGRGQICWITGASGSGSTRLAAELVHRGLGEDACVFAVHCDDLAGTPFGAIGRAGQDFIRLLKRLDPDQRTAWRNHLQEASDKYLPRVAQVSSTSFDLTEAARQFVGQDSGSPARFAEAIASFFLHLANADWPVMFVVDEFSAIDDASRQVIDQIARRLDDRHFLLVCTANERDDAHSRPDAYFDRVEQLPVGQLRLDPLDQQAVGELIAHELGGTGLPEQVVGRVVGRTQGVPMAVREYLFAMLEAGLLRPVRDGWQVDASGLSRLELPADVAQMMLDRVRRLDDPVKGVLATMAVEGQQFTVELAGNYVDADAGQVSDAVSRAVELRLVEHAHDDVYAFVHQEICAALLDELDADSLRAAHQRIAEALDNADADDDTHVFAVANHYARGQTAQNGPRVYQTNLKAGLAALDRNAFDEAYAYLSAAADFASAADPANRDPLSRGLGEACAAIGRVDEAVEHFDESIRRATDAVERARMRSRIARAQMAVLEMDAAWEQIQLALADLGHSVRKPGLVQHMATAWDWLVDSVGARTPKPIAHPNSPHDPEHIMAAELIGLGTVTAFFRLDVGLTAALCMRGMRMTRHLPNTTVKASAFANYAIILAVAGQAERARDYAARAVEIARSLDDRAALANARRIEASTYDFSGAALEGEAMFRATLQQLGLWLELWDYVVLCGELGGLLLDRGYTREASRWADRVLERTDVGGDHAGMVHKERMLVFCINAYAKARAGEGVAARRYIDRAHAVSDDRNTIGLVEASAVGYELAVHYESGNLGDDADALIDTWASFELVAERVPHELHRFYVYQGYVRFDQLRLAPKSAQKAATSRFRRALDLLSRAAKSARHLTHLYVLRAQWELRQGRPEPATALLDRAQHLADDADSPWGTFEVNLCWARRLAAQGNLQAAHRRARRAHGLAVRHGWDHRARGVRTEFEFFVDATSSALADSGPQDSSASNSHGSTDAQSLKLQRYLESLLEVAIASATVFDPQEQARVALDQVVRIFGAERAFLFVSPDTDVQPATALEMVAGRDARGRDLDDRGDYSASVIERVCAQRRPIVSTGSDEGDVLSSASAVHHNLRSIMAGPVQIQDHFLGVVYVDSRIARGVFVADDAEILMAISSHIGIARETARAAQLEVDIASERKKRELAEVIRHTTTAMAATLDPSEVLERMLDGIGRVIDADRAVAFLVEDGHLHTHADSGADAAATRHDPDHLLDDPRIARVLETKRPQLSDQQEPANSPPAQQAWVGAPIVSRGDLAGITLLERGPSRPYSRDDVQLILALASQAGIALQNARLFAQVERLAVVDELTDLPNRRRLIEVARSEFQRARRYDGPLSVIIFDIDHFKHVNDTHGHAIGDQVLREVSSRAGQSLRETDTIGRYGGEEFVVVMPQTSLRRATEHVAERLRQAVADPPVSTEAGEIGVTISLGVAGLASVDQTIDDLINRADQVLYDAKESGRNRVHTAYVDANDTP